MNLIDAYNLKVLSTKVYWDKPESRNEYKEFWNKYKEIAGLEKSNKEEYNKKKEILFITNDLKQVSKNENKYCKIIKFYKGKLVELGVMKQLPNKCVTKEGEFIKKKVVA